MRGERCPNCGVSRKWIILIALLLVSCKPSSVSTYKVTYVVQASPDSLVTYLDEHGTKVVGRMSGTSWSTTIVFHEGAFASISILSPLPSQCKIYVEELVRSTGTNQCSDVVP